MELQVSSAEISTSGAEAACGRPGWEAARREARLGGCKSAGVSPRCHNAARVILPAQLFISSVPGAPSLCTAHLMPQLQLLRRHTTAWCATQAKRVTKPAAHLLLKPRQLQQLRQLVAALRQRRVAVCGRLGCLLLIVRAPHAG